MFICVFHLLLVRELTLDLNSLVSNLRLSIISPSRGGEFCNVSTNASVNSKRQHPLPPREILFVVVKSLAPGQNFYAKAWPLGQKSSTYPLGLFEKI